MEIGGKFASTAVQEFKEHLHESAEKLGQRGDPDASSVAAFRNEMGMQQGSVQGGGGYNISPTDVGPSGGVSNHAAVSSTGDHILRGMNIQVRALGPPKVSGPYDAHHTFVYGFSDMHRSQAGNTLANSENPYVTQLSATPSSPPSSQYSPSEVTLSDVEKALSGPANTSPEVLLQEQIGIASFHMKEAVVVASSTKINQDVENIAKVQ